MKFVRLFGAIMLAAPLALVVVFPIAWTVGLLSAIPVVFGSTCNFMESAEAPLCWYRDLFKL